MAIGLAACGSASRPRALTAPSQKAPPLTGRTAASTTPKSAPSYCQALSQSVAVRGLGAAINRLAQAPTDPAAHATIRRAASALSSAANATTGAPRTALLDAAAALGMLDQHGLSAAPAVSAALQRAGSTLQSPCAFPIG
jgi:hypothetical protein